MIANDDPRFLRLLASIADTTLPQNERMAALEELMEDWLPESHPYRSEPLWSLFDRLKAPHEERLWRIQGRGILKRVARPPVCLQDIL